MNPKDSHRPPIRQPVTTALLLAALPTAQGKARVAILATGGTTAGAGDASGYGYEAGAFEVEDLRRAALERRLAAAVKDGIVAVRSTRLERGMVLRNNEIDDEKMGFVASRELNPPKSRVLLRRELMSTNDPVRVQKIFDEY